MKGLVYLTLVLLCAVVVSGCAGRAPAAGAVITPGLRNGALLFTQSGTEAVSYVTTMKCPVDQTTNAKSCVLRVGTKANIGTGFYDHELYSGKTLDEMWPGLTHKMVVDGQVVDLQAFGYIDTAMPGIGTMRIPNVVVVADGPGRITIRSTGVFDGKPFAYDTVLTFTATGA